MSEVATLLEFRPIHLHIDRIGPFQETPTTIDFTDADGKPCSFFLLLSRNGRGKTTAMEIMAYLVETLARVTRPHRPQFSVDNPDGRAQLDLIVEVQAPRGGRQRVLLSLMVGISDSSSLMHWGTEKLANIAASAWDRHAVLPSWTGRFSEQSLVDDEGTLPALKELIHIAQGRPPAGFGVDKDQSNPETAPALLYFPSNRDITKLPETEQRTIGRPLDWDYRTLRRFDREPNHWSASLDNLLVWLKWLEDGRFERACRVINEFVFKGSSKRITDIRKDPPEAIVESQGNKHRLDQLSSGEKSLVLLFLLMSAHMTRNTIVLIDEVDLHLHPEWERRVVQQLKDLILQHEGLTVIMSAHSHDILRQFDVHVPELPLRKGGELLADEPPLQGIED